MDIIGLYENPQLTIEEVAQDYMDGKDIDIFHGNSCYNSSYCSRDSLDEFYTMRTEVISEDEYRDRLRKGTLEEGVIYVLWEN